jgi:hypothetical protein
MVAQPPAAPPLTQTQGAQQQPLGAQGARMQAQMARQGRELAVLVGWQPFGPLAPARWLLRPAQ